MEEEVIKQMTFENFNAAKEREKKGILLINGPFTPLMMENIAFKLLSLAENKNIPEITLYINSNGGYVDSFNPLMDIIDTIKKPVSTIVLGKAYSAGAMLLLCGHKGHRFAYKNAEILIHEVADFPGYAKNTQTQHNAKNLDRINNLLISIIKERTKMKKEEIYKYMHSNSDIFITAKEALRYGIIDKII